MKKIQFEPEALSDYNNWALENKKIFIKIAKLIFESARNPFYGTGKPENLKYIKENYWSRRIDEEHRLVYKVTDTTIIIISCKYHYPL